MDRLRVAQLASYYPKPRNPVMGIWALMQSQAIARQGVRLDVDVFSMYVPRTLRHLPAIHPTVQRLKAWADVPAIHDWSGVEAAYHRWPVYHRGPGATWRYRNPNAELELAWRMHQDMLRAIARRADVIYAIGSLGTGALAARLHEETGIPYVTMDAEFNEMADCGRFPGRGRLLRRVAASSGAMTVVSERLAKTVARLQPGTKVETIPVGANPIPDGMRARPRPRELEGRRVVTTVTAFYERKNVPLLIDAFSRVAATRDDVVLRVLGDGEDRPAVDAAVARSPAADRIHLRGFRPHSEVQQELAWADVFALLSRDEPFATVFCEAMSAGLPLVCCDDGGVVDSMVDGREGLLVPPDDLEAATNALAQLLDDARGRSDMGRAAEETFVRELTWDSVAARYVEIFERVAAGAS